MKARDITQITWTKDPDPSTAPEPGVYVAMDLTSRFTEVDRHCGYLVLHQSSTGGPFKVSREEANYISNATARGLSPTAVDQAWATLSSRCPNYSVKPAAVASPVVKLTDPPNPLPETSGHPTGYATVAAALAGLHAQRGVTFKEQQGWTIATDETGLTIWTFPPKGHPAYPSAVKRQMVTSKDGTDLHMSISCESSKAACDDLVRTFNQLNDQLTASLRPPR